MSKSPLLMIPGPIEMDDEVLQAMSHKSVSHVDPEFISAFGNALKKMRDVFLAPDGQPLVVAGSGSLGWDMFGANVLEEGEEALVISSGYFGDSFEEFLSAQGVKVTKISCAPGDFPSFEEIRKLNLKRFKAVTITAVDTSTAVAAPVKKLAKLLRQDNPEIIICIDGVASLGGEELRMKEWDIDFAMTGSQKVLGVPAGLCICMARERALKAASSRKTPVRMTYVSWKKWIPILENYEHEKGSYFATPPVHMIYALDVALTKYLANGGADQRFKDHANVANAFRASLKAMDLKTVALNAEISSNTLTAIYYPENVDGNALRTAIKNNGAIVAGGIHKQIAAKYFRVGHMGYSVHGGRRDHVWTVIQAIMAALKEQKYEVDESKVKKAFEEHAKL